jgi:REP-associated tyrosine transposase
LRSAFCAACRREGFRITDWSVQGDHIHFVAEAAGNTALARGVQGLCVRIARGLNGLCGRKGPVFTDRYHARVLRTPREVRNCLAYVLLNARHHGIHLPKGSADPCSSGASFDGWRTAPVPSQSSLDDGPPGTAPPRTWLRQVGWRRHGLVRLDEVPGGCHPNR